jgi:capsular polysaccharide biosynthesis protein
MWPLGMGNDLPERFWPEGDFPPVDEQLAADPTARLVTFSFLWAAVKRRKVLCLSLAVIGLVIGVGLYKTLPPSYSASTTILLTDGPNEDPQVQITADTALAKSTQVAADVVQKLKLQQSVASFLTAYSVTAPADLVLNITMTAPSGTDALARANAVDAAFLAARAQFATAQQAQLEESLNAQVKQAQSKLNTINTEISHLSSSGGSQTQLATLQAQKTQAANSLAQIQVDVTGTLVSSRTQTNAMIKNTVVINSATLAKHSKVKTGGIYVGGGLMGGLVIGLAIILLQALLSNRLRRRDDVAYALGAPVRLSVGPLAPSRLPSLGDNKNHDRDLSRVVEYLGHAVPGASRGPAGLAVIALDDAATVAAAVVALAQSYAGQGKRVVLADLSADKSAAALVGGTEPGMRRVTAGSSTIMLFVPESTDAMPVGPMRNGTVPAGLGQPNEAVVGGASSADMVLALATLDPAFGADYLATWASDAVAVVTCGKSNAGEIRAAGEMVRIAGVRLGSAVLIGADKNDESLGAWSGVL